MTNEKVLQLRDAFYNAEEALDELCNVLGAIGEYSYLCDETRAIKKSYQDRRFMIETLHKLHSGG